MSIIGIGIDILSITRIKNVIYKLGKKFSRRILSNNELDEYKNNKNPILFLAKRFSIKEAASKALGTGIKNGIKFNNFELYHDNLGKPYVRFLNQAKKIAEHLNVNLIHVSLSDEKSYITTVVIIEK
ncbi:MAG: holo-ACP synthase [Buchnera aphidicola (Meitanaphis microgallis)]